MELVEGYYRSKHCPLEYYLEHDIKQNKWIIRSLIDDKRWEIDPDKPRLFLNNHEFVSKFKEDKYNLSFITSIEEEEILKKILNFIGKNYTCTYTSLKQCGYSHIIFKNLFAYTNFTNRWEDYIIDSIDINFEENTIELVVILDSYFKVDKKDMIVQYLNNIQRYVIENVKSIHFIEDKGENFVKIKSKGNRDIDLYKVNIF